MVSGIQIPSAWVLSLDRTTWKLGSHWHSIERMRLMETFAKRVPTAVVNYWCADREFIGQAWVRYLLLEPS